MTTPPKPAIFAPELAPEGVEVRFVTFATTRPHIAPRLILVHTNGAENEGTVDSAWNWSHAAPGVNTCPHYQVDRTHNGVTRARKMLATNRRGIGNATELASQGNHGNVSNWSIVVETADLGWPTAKRPTAPGGATGFDPGQGELIATILAYESIVHDFPLEYPADWYMAGAATHTEPFGYPYWTIKKGKPCPGDAKKRDMRNWVLPRAREIVAAWTHPIPAPLPPPAPTPQPPTRPPAQFDEEDDMLDKVLVPRGDWVRDNHPWLACFDSGLVRPLASNDIQPRNGNADVTDEGQYRRLAAWARIPL